jgi:hypothetical protein
MPFGKGEKKKKMTSPRLNRSTWVKKGENKRSSFHLQVTSGMHFYNVHSSQGIWVAAQSQCFVEGFHVTEFQENILNLKNYIFTDSTSVSDR